MSKNQSVPEPQNINHSQTGFVKKENVPEKATTVFLVAGLIFLLVALGLFGLSGFSLYRLIELGPIIEVPGSRLIVEGTVVPELNSRDIYNFYGRIASIFMGPILVFLSAIVCTFVGIRLLRSAGAVTQEVIPTRDYDLIAPAIREGNEKAVSEYIRLRSLSGMTGTFTKIGLTGLPLATIVLTIFLAIIGVFQEKFFDLAQLTLGAFIGSYVQKKGEENQVPSK